MTGRLPLSVNKSAAGGESTSPLCDSALEGSGVSFPLQGDQKRKPAEPYALVRIREEPATRRPPVGGNHGRPAATDFRSAGLTPGGHLVSVRTQESVACHRHVFHQPRNASAA